MAQAASKLKRIPSRIRGLCAVIEAGDRLTPEQRQEAITWSINHVPEPNASLMAQAALRMAVGTVVRAYPGQATREEEHEIFKRRLIDLDDAVCNATGDMHQALEHLDAVCTLAGQTASNDEAAEDLLRSVLMAIEGLTESAYQKIAAVRKSLKGAEATAVISPDDLRDFRNKQSGHTSVPDESVAQAA